MSEHKKHHHSIWTRGLYMLLFAIFYGVAEFVMGVVVIVQFFHHVFTTKPHQRLLSFGASIATYIYQVLRFLTFNSEVMPFPFSDWPEGEEPDRTITEALPEKEGEE